MPALTKASHIVGADLAYTHVTGSTYKVTLSLYGDCGPMSAAAVCALRLRISAPLPPLEVLCVHSHALVHQEIHMSSIRVFIALSSAVFFTACAATAEPGGAQGAAVRAAEHASHHPAGAASAPASPRADRMQAMREMRDKMMNAKTPEERQALMAEHMLAMQGGMLMMKGMGGGMGGGMGAKPGAGPMGGMGAQGMPDAMAQRQKMMEERMDMMQMMMDMMMQRMPASGVPPVAK